MLGRALRVKGVGGRPAGVRVRVVVGVEVGYGEERLLLLTDLR